jgi:hypothetical protein
MATRYGCLVPTFMLRGHFVRSYYSLAFFYFLSVGLGVWAFREYVINTLLAWWKATLFSHSPRYLLKLCSISTLATFSRKGASGRNMLPVHPHFKLKDTPWMDPQIPLNIQKYEVWHGGDEYREGMLKIETPWTMGKVYDFIEQEAEVEGITVSD